MPPKAEKNTERLEMRVPTAFLEAVDDWRRAEKDLPSRSEAIRRLAALGLEHGKRKASK